MYIWGLRKLVRYNEALLYLNMLLQYARQVVRLIHTIADFSIGLLTNYQIYCLNLQIIFLVFTLLLGRKNRACRYELHKKKLKI